MFSYLIRLSGDREVTEGLIVDVYQDIWCEAPVFDGADGPVLGWIMRLARARALAATTRGLASASKDSAPHAADDQRLMEDRSVHVALATLTTQEREAIEATVLNGLTYTELAAQWQETVGTIKSRIRSGLLKLQQALRAGVDES